MRNIRSYLFVICSTIFFITQPAVAQYEELIVFGDSLSDTGNLATLNPQIGVVLNTPPYFEGRVSNGPVAVDVLADLMGVPLTAFFEDGGTNFAVAGARAAVTGDAASDAIRLSAQVSAYLSTAQRPTAATLVVIMIGGNDVRGARTLSRKTAKKKLEAATESIARQIQRLITAGADSFMVIGAPDVSRIPETRLLAGQAGNSVIRNARWSTAYFNFRLNQRIDDIETTSGARIVDVDLVAFLSTIDSDPGDYGITVARRACFVTGDDGVPVFDRACGVTNDKINKFMYFDAIHPTTVVHERAGRLFYTLMPAPVDGD